VPQAVGAILAHSEHLPDGRLRKGVVLTAGDVARLQAAGRATVTVASLAPDDLPEDKAAAMIAAAVRGPGLALTDPVNGRVNLKAEGPGIVQLDTGAIHALNRVHPAITVATLPAWHRVTPGALAATVKIIAYAAPQAAVHEAAALAAGAIALRPVTLRTAALVQTEVAGQDPKLSAKGERAVRGRLRALGVTLTDSVVVPHDEAALATALARATADLVLILTGSATSDLHDTAPMAVRQVGGDILRYGMPVDPGNLLFLGRIARRPVIGLPGCARSPALNGADWVLERICCGVNISDDDIAAMGVGGLLKEIPQRPQPRE
jgi:molybdenum cofactor cytidylyltransferase